MKSSRGGTRRISRLGRSYMDPDVYQSAYDVDPFCAVSSERFRRLRSPPEKAGFRRSRQGDARG